MKKIRTKIIMAILMCSLLTAAVIGTLAMYNSSRMASEDSKERARTEGELYAERINGIISQIEQSVNTLSDAVSNDFDYEAFVKSKKYADEYTELITDAAVNFASHTDGAVTAYVRYNPQYSNPTSGIFMSRDSLNDEFTLLTPTDFSMYDEDDSAHVGWYYQPVKAGLVQALGVFIDTIVICSCTAMIMLLAPEEKVAGLSGMDLLQTAMEHHLGRFGVVFIAATLFLFSFSTFLGILFYARSNVAYLFGDNWISQTAYKIIALFMLFIGGLAAYTFVWDLGDVGIGLMTIFNIILLYPQGEKALKELKKYEESKKHRKERPEK